MIDIALFMVQLGLVIAAIWYSVETRKLRLQNIEEIRLLKKQGQLSLAPFLVPGAEKLTINQLNDLIDSKEDTSDEEKNKEKDAVKAAKNDVFFVVQVTNPTADKLGAHLESYIYDPSTKSFLIPDHGKEWISPQEKEIIQVTGPYVTESKIKEELLESYGNIAEPLFKHLDMPDENGYIALFFQDIEGTLYLSKRMFVYKNKEIYHKSTKLFSSTLG